MKLSYFITESSNYGQSLKLSILFERSQGKPPFRMMLCASPGDTPREIATMLKAMAHDIEIMPPDAHGHGGGLIYRTSLSKQVEALRTDGMSDDELKTGVIG